MKIYLAHSTAFDFKQKLYQPLRTSSLNAIYQFIFPHAQMSKPHCSKKNIKGCDLIVAEVSYPSTGVGIELGWANLFGKPIMCIYQLGANYSTSLAVITHRFVPYKNSEDLIETLVMQLAKISQEVSKK